jgi:Ser/Thr protein kinase RdoA (MazF antagonist)
VLGAADVAEYLLARELIAPRAVVEGDLRIAEHSRLNRVYVVTTRGERPLVVKVGDGVAREAAILERLERDGELARSLPVIIAHDPGERVLVLESPPVARDLMRHHARGRFSCALAREAGRTLALLHSMPRSAVDGLAHEPWDARLHRPDLDALRALSAAGIELTRIVQASAVLCADLDELLASWSAASIVHGDVRWDNWLALRAGTGGWSRLQLIDWERAGTGDPALDVGAFLGEYLRAWGGSIPIPGSGEPPLRAQARLPLRRMRPALRAFWAAYTRARPAGAGELRRATRFAAVRLLTAALEEAQARDELAPSVLELVALGEHVMERPGRAAELLGVAA